MLSHFEYTACVHRPFRKSGRGYLGDFAGGMKGPFFTINGFSAREYLFPF